MTQMLLPGAVLSRSAGPGGGRVCPVCLKDFVPYSRAEGYQKYCSEACRVRAWKSRIETPEDKAGRDDLGRLPSWNETAQKTREALEAVEAAAKRQWLEDAHEALVACARARAEFISDDVWHYGLERTREDRALGPVFLRAKREGLIEKTNRLRPSVRSHLSGKPVWRSLVFRSEP